jgi:hypothetical protein
MSRSTNVSDGTSPAVENSGNTRLPLSCLARRGGGEVGGLMHPPRAGMATFAQPFDDFFLVGKAGLKQLPERGEKPSSCD